MPEEEQNTLAGAVQAGAGAPKDAAFTAIEQVGKIAEELGMQETAAATHEVGKQLQSDAFQIMVAGRFKNGKSTLLNALLGGTTVPVDLGGRGGPMVMDDLPATATLTAIHYAEKPYVRMHAFDGSVENWSLGRYLAESHLDGSGNEKDNAAKFQHIREFEMGFPARLCEAGVVVYDSPGLDDAPARTLVTQRAVEHCDLAIVVYRSDVLMGQQERMDAADMIAQGTRVFTVVNLQHGKKVDDRLKGFVWDRAFRADEGDVAWSGQDLTARRVFFVDAEAARQARYDGDDEAAERSGLNLLEKELARYLVLERQVLHLEKHVTMATRHISVIEGQIDKRRTAISADRQQLSAAAEAVWPKLTAIRQRPAKLPRIIRRYRLEAESQLRTSFLELIAATRRDLPAHLLSVDLPSGSKFARVFRQKPMEREAVAEVSAYLKQRIDDWSRTGAQDVLKPLLLRMAEEIEDEVTRIAEEFDDVHLELSGWRVSGSGESVVGPTERVLSVLGSVLAGNLFGAVGAGAGGWRGAVASLAGAFGSGVVMGLLGVTSMVVFWPVALAGAIVFGVLGGGIDLEKRVKNKLLKELDPQLATMPNDLEPVLRTKLAAKFEALETDVAAAVERMVDEEERSIREVIDLNRMNQQDKERTEQQLVALSAELAQRRTDLQRALLLARQTG
jgi:hypothetical protein